MAGLLFAFSPAARYRTTVASVSENLHKIMTAVHGFDDAATTDAAASPDRPLLAISGRSAS